MTRPQPLRGIIFGSIVLLCGSVLAEPPRAVGTPERRPPSDAVVIFDGTSRDALVSRDGTPCRWPIVDGALVAQHDGGLWTKLHFRDAQIHAEFATPQQGPGNSGLYIHGQFELQIFNSYGSLALDSHSHGAVYGIRAPLVNVSRPPGQWQSYDIVFVAPRRAEDGKVTAPGSITALLNGVLVQNHTEVREPVSHFSPLVFRRNAYIDKLRQSLLKTGTGPLHLQDHETRVRFRNLWIRPLDELSRTFAGT